MFRIRKIADQTQPGAARELAQVQDLLRARLPGLPSHEIDELPERLRDPVQFQLRSYLYVADDLRGRLHSFALLSHAPDVGFCLLDYIATGGRASGGGIGGALYERVRQASRELGSVGLFFECLPDEPDACSDPAFAKQNAARIRFYERAGARVVVGTGYETPLGPGGRDLPHLLFDDLGTGAPLAAATARAVFRAILERKYAAICPPDYIDAVVDSVRDDPVRLRAPQSQPTRTTPLDQASAARIKLVVNDEHDIHHVRERGYVEAPVRIRSILDGIEPLGVFQRVPPRSFPDDHLTRVHDPGLVEFVREACAKVPAGKSIYPYVFPVRNRARPPADLSYCAGYWCIDTFTPLDQNAWRAARRAVDCALTAADALLAGDHLAYALVRPPGHHAERSVFGGFCYFNNAAIAADHLSNTGRVAMLDIDYHHGNGQQDVFWRRGDVLTVSIHGDPQVAYPFFSGFADEHGEGDGLGCNLNLPLPETITTETWFSALDSALQRIREFGPRWLVVALGFDIAKRDPTGSWSLQKPDFERIGAAIRAAGLPTLIVQEGGYRSVTLGANAAAFFAGLARAPRTTRGNTP